MTIENMLNLKLMDSKHFDDELRGWLLSCINEMCCEEVFDKIVQKKGLNTEEALDEYDFYADPLWISTWNKKVNELAKELKLE